MAHVCEECGLYCYCDCDDTLVEPQPANCSCLARHDKYDRDEDLEAEEG